MTRSALLFLLAAAPLAAQFAFRDVDDKSLALTENGAPVFTYNYGQMLKAGVPEDRRRCCYLYPVAAPNGAIVTDDFPRDHYHHRGISWMWPVVTVGGKTYDLWTIKGMHARSEKILKRDASADRAVLEFVNGWYVDDRKVMEEHVTITALPAKQGHRDIDFNLVFTPQVDDVSISGSPESNKGYGGFSIRFAPRTGTRLDSATGQDVPDSDGKPNAWAELTGDFAGKPATTRITIDPANPGAPNGWTLRHYGFLGVNYPGLDIYKFQGRQPLTLKYRVTLSGAESQVSSSGKRVLVYTKNGKGYVHDNIADSVAAIRRMGAESGFGVDATDDPNFFTDATLHQYKVIVFSNTNNEAFNSDAQRQALEKFVKDGGGIVGIHSASGSERTWPDFWRLMGGKFVRHPKLQPFTVRVVDPKNPATAHLDSSFQWEDECYFLEFLNPLMHPLLVTDPTKLDDPVGKKQPAGLVGNALPLSWTLEGEGGRRFYTALGHKKEYYSTPLFYKHVMGGILWAMGERP